MTKFRRARWKEVPLDKQLQGFTNDDQLREMPDKDVNMEASAKQNEPLSVSPLTWSHAACVSAIQTFLQENERVNAFWG